jgi:hypothetical protein
LNSKIVRITFALIVLVIIFVVLILGYFALSELNQKSNTLPNKTPIPLVNENFSVDKDIAISGYTGWINVSQGTNFNVNLTLTSLAGQIEKVQIENLTLTYYNSQVKLGSNINTLNDYSSIQRSTFNYSLGINPVTIQPIMSNSTIITINLAQDAPTGQYTIAVKVTVEGLQPNGTFKQKESHTHDFNMIVY